MTTARVALECMALTGVLYFACFGVGWWLWQLTARRLRSVSVWTGAPIMGLAVSMVVAYYWAGHGGLDEIALWLLGVSLAADAVVAWRARREIRLDARVLRSTSWVIVVAAGTSALFAWHRIQTFRIGRLSTGSLFLADLPNFALTGDHVGRSGLQGVGSIVGYNLSALAAQTPGSIMFMSLASSWIGRPEFQATLPVLLFCTILIAFAARDLARLMVPWSRLLPAVLAIAATGVSMFVYSSAHYPLSQLLAVPCAVGFLLIVAETALHARSSLSPRRIISLALFFAPIVLAYPHMAVLAPPVLVAIALAAAVGREWRRRIGVSLATALLGMLLVVVALPGVALEVPTRLRQVGDVQGAGFALTLLTPADLLGFRSSYVAYAHDPSLVAQFAFEAVLLGLLIALVLLWTRGKSRSRAALASAAAFGTLGAYALVFLVRGASYVQWKWAAFFVPIFVVGTLSILAWLCAVGTRRLPTSARRVGFGFVNATVIAVVVSGGLFAHDATEEFVADLSGHGFKKQWVVVNHDLIALGSIPADTEVRAVNVEVSSTSESSWAAYFLAPLPTYLASVKGITSVPPLARWTLERNDRAFVHPPHSDVRVLNATYRLVRERPDKVEPGTLWVVGACDGVYRFDGARWRGVERTTETGGFEISLTPESHVPNTRVPLLVRAGTSSVDALLLEYLPRNSARVVSEHLAAGSMTGDARLGSHAPFARGQPFPLAPGTSLELSVVFDPITGEERVESGGSVLFDSTTTFVVPQTLGRTVGGSNPRGAAFADEEFHGKFEIASTQTPLCESLPASARDV